jgi:D-alanyl-D-alanine dipeptidase
MKRLIIILIFPSILAIYAPIQHNLVNIKTINKNIKLDIRYATTNNFTKVKVYPQPVCFLNKTTAKKLDMVCC